jgi:hypothetical protein
MRLETLLLAVSVKNDIFTFSVVFWLEGEEIRLSGQILHAILLWF